METVDQVNFDLATEEYESIVASCADNDSSQELSNRHIAHAAILTRHIIRRSQHCVDILTGSLPELFFNQIRSQVESAIQKNVLVRIVFANGGAVCDSLFGLARQYPKQLLIYEISDEYREKVKKSICHFCVSDNKRWRIEEVHPDKDFSKDPAISALANFNRPQEAKVLHSSFDDLVDLSNPVKLS